VRAGAIRIDLKTWGDADEPETVGSFVLMRGSEAIEIEASEEGRRALERILKDEERIPSFENGKRGPIVSWKTDPAAWLRGLLLQYDGSRVWAALGEE
jgi:hypothetical protein